MSAPPGVQVRQQVLAGSTNSEGDASVRRAPAVDALVRAVHASPELRALGLSPSKVSRTVRAFIVAGLRERDFVSYVVGYADPTGEAAVRNVMRAAR